MRSCSPWVIISRRIWSNFIQRNLRLTVNSRGPMQIGSILLLFFTANGIFEPMEVALNRAWGIPQNRSFLKNQLVSMGLDFLCGGLILFRSFSRQRIARSCSSHRWDSRKWNRG